MRSFATSIAVILFTAFIVFAEEVPLSYEGMGETDLAAVVRTATGMARSYPSKPKEIKAVPSGLTRDASFCRIDLPCGDAFIAILDPARVPALYVDMNHNNDLSDDAKISGELASNRSGMIAGVTAAVFGPVELPLSDAAGGGAAQIFLEVYNKDYIMVYPAGLVTGEVRLAGRRYKMAFVDANHNGRYDSTFAQVGGPDIIAFDMDSNGRFENDGAVGIEIFPLPKIVPLRSQYYSLAVNADGSSCVFEEVSPPTGSVEVPADGVSAFLLSENGPYTVSSAKRAWALPAGEYLVAGVSLELKENGVPWTAVASKGAHGPVTVEIKEGETSTLDLGPPFVIATDVQEYSDQISIGLVGLVGKAGELYDPAVEINGVRVPAPKLRILDESGNVLASGAFEWG